jgi:hypothetical protein
VIELTPALAISAAVISDNHKLPMADSIILATAQAYEATLWTQDEHFQGIAGVEYIAKPFPREDVAVFVNRLNCRFLAKCIIECYKTDRLNCARSCPIMLTRLIRRRSRMTGQ